MKPEQLSSQFLESVAQVARDGRGCGFMPKDEFERFFLPKILERFIQRTALDESTNA